MNEFLLELINVGRQRAISCANLSQKTGIAQPAIRAAIAGFRSEGIPICSCPDGYYFGGIADVRNTIDSLERRIRNQQKAIDGLKGRL